MTLKPYKLGGQLKFSPHIGNLFCFIVFFSLLHLRKEQTEIAGGILKEIV